MKKRKYTIIEIVISIIVMGILTSLASPKMSGYKNNSNVASINLDLEILDMAIKLYNANSNNEYPLKDLNNDKIINEKDLFYFDSVVPSNLKKALLEKKQDTSEELYQIDLDKLKPYINGLNCENKLFLYSTQTNTVINPLGETDGNEIQHFFIE